MSETTTRRAFLVNATIAMGTLALPAALAEPAAGERIILDGIDRFRVREPNFEGVRIVLNARGEKYSPAYIQGISGAAFRIAGICPCAPNCSTQMWTTDLVKLLGYGYSEHIVGWTGDVEPAKKSIVTMIPKVKASIRAGRPVLVWYAFADTAFEVVCGFDDAQGVFIGWHAQQSPDDPMATAKQTRAAETVQACPAFGALFIEEKVGEFASRPAEIAALREAVRHARDQEVKTQGPPRAGLACYDHWVEEFKKPDTSRDNGNAYCHFVYRSTHRSASEFLREIGPNYPNANNDLMAAAKEFTAEADALDEGAPLISFTSPQVSAERNEKLWPTLARARNHYATAISHIEDALRAISPAA